MYKNKTFVALIPARGGSVSVPKKNIALLAGKPLIRYTIEVAEKSKYLDDIYCTTDDDEIAYIASQNSKCAIIKRPKRIASNTSKIIECVIHALQILKRQGKEFDYLVILQPTSPLRTVEEIDCFIKHIINHNLPSCVSISPLPFLPVLMRHIKEKDTGENALENIFPGSGTVRRQDYKTTYYVDGSLYAYATKEILEKKEKISFNDAPFGFINNQLLDINTPDDLLLAETLLKSKS